MEIKLNYKKVVIIRGHGTDQILLTLDEKHHSTPYPGLDYPAIMKIETQHGYAEKYCEKLGITNFDVIKI